MFQYNLLHSGGSKTCFLSKLFCFLNAITFQMVFFLQWTLYIYNYDVIIRDYKVNFKKYYMEWGKIHSILVLHKSIINEEEKMQNKK